MEAVLAISTGMLRNFCITRAQCASALALDIIIPSFRRPINFPRIVSYRVFAPLLSSMVPELTWNLGGMNTSRNKYRSEWRGSSYSLYIPINTEVQ